MVRKRTWSTVMALVLFGVAVSTGKQNPDPQVNAKVNADVYPPSQFEIRVYQHNPDGDVAIGNNTHLMLTARIVRNDAAQTVLQPYIAKVGIMTDPDVIGPQASILRGFWESTKEFPYPKGKNATVEVLTAGWRGDEYLPPEEQALVLQLRIRTLVDQIALPLATTILGEVENKRIRVLRNILMEAFAQNTKILEDLKYEAYDKGSFKEGLTVIWNFIFREVENGGFIYDEILKRLDVNAKHKLTQWLLKRKIIDKATDRDWRLKALKYLFDAVNYGPDVIQGIKTLDDMHGVPAKLRFRVYFETGVDSIEPRSVYLTDLPVPFLVRGYHMYDDLGSPEVRFADRNGRVLYRARADWVLPNGSQLQMTVPSAMLRGVAGPLSATVRMNEKDYPVPGEIRLVSQLKITHLVPSRGIEGQTLEVYGEGLNRYFVNSTVHFGNLNRSVDIPVSVSRVADGYFVTRVPVLPASVADDQWKVWVEESSGMGQKRSNQLGFVKLPGTARELAEQIRNQRMEESDTLIDGILTSAEPEKTHDLMIPGGMQVNVTLEDLQGPDPNEDVELAAWGLYLYRPQSDGGERAMRATEFSRVRGRQPMARLSHTTSGEYAINHYRLYLRSAQRIDVTYRVRVQTIRRDDAATGLDAPNWSWRAIPLLNGATVRACLFGERKFVGEDLTDVYRLPNVQPGHKIRITLIDIRASRPFAESETTMGGFTLLKEVSPGEVTEVANYAGPLRSRDLPATMSYEDPNPASYLLRFEHGNGNVEYSFRVDVGFEYGPSPDQQPITSRFNDGSDEGWTTGPLRSPGERPVWEDTTERNGFVRHSETAASSAGALDLVFVIDITGSMKPVIESVKLNARTIAERLRARTTEFRLGLVSFADIAAAGAAARTVYPFSPDIQAQLESLRDWRLADGGDDPEDVLYALAGALDMDWRASDSRRQPVAKAIVFVTDNPAKVGDGGRDERGNSVDSIVSAARAKGVAIFPVLVQPNAAAQSQFAPLASRTDGLSITLSDVSKLVQTLEDAAQLTIERSTPRYWIAPSKFLGDVSRFYGRTLAFDVRSTGARRGFSRDDVILEGGGKRIRLRSHLRPNRGSAERAEWTHVVVRLREDAHWFLPGSGGRAKREDLIAVFSNLQSMRLRAEFDVGEDTAYLDNVVLGSFESPTDVGLTAKGVSDAVYLQSSLETFEEHLSDMRQYLSRDPTLSHFEKLFQKASIRTSAASAQDMTSRFLAAVREPRGSACFDRMFRMPVIYLRQWITLLRQNGQLTPEQKDRLLADVRVWNDSYQAFIDKVKAYKVACAKHVFARETLDHQTEADTLETLTRLDREFALLGRPILFMPPR